MDELFSGGHQRLQGSLDRGLHGVWARAAADTLRRRAHAPAPAAPRAGARLPPWAGMAAVAWASLAAWWSRLSAAGPH